jgi:glycine betaine/proline transport system ATP-binding protein
MQQRVGLARALAVKPDILLYDEPFSALDPLIRREMQDELLRLQSTLHKTSIFITHDFVEALKLGDRIAIMRNGEFVQVGTPQELVLNPNNDYVKAFVRDAPRAKVLTASSVMYPGGIGYTNMRSSVQGDTSLEEVLPLLSDHDQPIVVVNREGAPLGMIDRKAVLRALTPID